MNRQALRDFFITVFFLGLAFIIAVLSSIAADQGNSPVAAIAAAISLLLATIGAIYIIPRLARNVRLEMLRFAVRTSVTKEGILFFAFLAVIGFSAWNTGNNLLYLVLSAMIAFIFAANLIGRLSVSELSVQLRFPDHLFANEEATMNVSITNHKRFMPSYSFIVETLSEEGRGNKGQGTGEEGEKGRKGEREQALTPDGAPHSALCTPHSALSMDSGLREGLGKLEYFLLVPARSSVRKRIHHTFEKRGLYRITGFRIATKFPAGFFEKWRRIDATGEIIVYPKPQPLDDFYHTLPMLAGQVQAQTRGSGDELYAIRRYQNADHMRHIDWKATAKMSALMVREKMREDERRLTIVFDTVRRSSNQGGEASFAEQFERAVIRAASLANHFILEQSEVELITTDEKLNVPSGSGQETLYKILRSLATIEPTGTSLKMEVDEEEERPRRLQRLLQKQLDWQARRMAQLKEQMGRAGRIRRAYRRCTLWFIEQDVKLLSRFVKDDAAQQKNPAQQEETVLLPPDKRQWKALDQIPILMNERRFKVLITSAPKGSIPAGVWRSAHVMYLEDV